MQIDIGKLFIRNNDAVLSIKKCWPRNLANRVDEYSNEAIEAMNIG